MRICLQPWICYCRRSLCIVSLLSTLALLELGQAAAAPAGGGPRVQGEDMWEFRAKLMPAPDEAAYFALAEAGKALLRLVVRSWRACQGTLVIGVTGGSLAQVGLDMSTAHTIRKCGNSMAHRCSFHEASVFRTVVGVAWEEDVAGEQLVGYFLQDSFWAQLDLEQCSDAASFHPMEHPLRASYPQGFDLWISERLLDRGFLVEDGKAVAADGDGHSITAEAAEATSQVCSDDVSEVWDLFWPPERPETPKQIVIIGCGSLSSEPTGPLLDRGAGGLFIDADRRVIRMALAGPRVAPHRRILNSTVSVGSVPRLLRTHAPFVRDVEVLQVDIDTVDGPVVMKLLEFLSPRAVVVEVRNFLPFPFRYACLTTDTKGLAWGGANLAYWLYELGIRGYRLLRMDSLDAVFVHHDDPVATAADLTGRRHFLGTLGCYVRNMLKERPPAALFRDILRKQQEEAASSPASPADNWSDLWRGWFGAKHPHGVLHEAWGNLTAWRNDIPFTLSS
mmetsp:Transcript_95875/g.310784  ORF Transcript_95875/g.310784 Transcript_95875/m.310784 type:complete len:506 (+) Transcript_95875:99-1616(+)